MFDAILAADFSWFCVLLYKKSQALCWTGLWECVQLGVQFVDRVDDMWKALYFCVHPCWRGNKVRSKEGTAEITVQLIAFDLATNQLDWDWDTKSRGRGTGETEQKKEYKIN